MRIIRAMAAGGVMLFASTLGAQWQSSATPGAIYYDGGNVGIGVSAPNYPLHIFGTARFDHSTGRALMLVPGGSTTNNIYSYGDGTNGYYGLNFRAASYAFRDSGGSTRLFIGDRVGIGTVSPLARFEVVSAGAAAAFDSGAPQDARLEFKRQGARQGFLSWDAGTVTLAGDPAAGAALLFRTGDAERMRISAAGSIGIGVSNPLARLDVSDAVQTSVRILLSGQEYFQPGSARTGGVAAILGVNRENNKQLWIADSESLGQATAAPVLRLAVISGAAFIDASATDGTPRRLDLAPDNTIAIGAGTGKVAIGTTTPSLSSKLHVVGDSTFTGNATFSGTVTGGNIQAKYQDIAEWVPTTEQISAGTVVVLDGSHNNHVRASSRAYDTSVAGVVSEQPGLILGEAGDAKAMIATTGRVRVKVDATRAPIAIGDLLVTSDRAGIAMKSLPIDLGGVPFHRPGTLIGKALEPLDGGVGEILVLLSLQ